MKNYTEFKQEILEKIGDFLPEELKDAELSIQDTVKNNGQIYSGLTIKKEFGISPVLYLEPYYERYKDGVPMSELIKRVADTYTHAMEHDGIPQDSEKLVSELLDWDKIKERIYPKIVNYKANERKLADVPHKRIADLCVLYYVDLTSSDDGSRATVTISNEMFSRYEDIKIQDLHGQAVQNLLENRKTQIQDIVEVLSALMVPGFKSDHPEEPQTIEQKLELCRDAQMLVLSNETKVFSAANLLDTKTMDALTEFYTQGFFILPSSIHECLIVPRTEGMDLETLKSMVKEVNETQVAPDEFLSNNIYAYDPLTKSIYIAEDRIKEAVLQFQSGVCLYVKECDNGYYFRYYDNTGVMLDHGNLEGIDDIKDAIDKALEEYHLSAKEGWPVPVDVFKAQINALQKNKETAVI